MSRDTPLDPLPTADAPFATDVHVWRTRKNGPCETNVPHTVVWHSPDGFQFGYAGSGPADLALNILNAFVPPRKLYQWSGDRAHLNATRPVKCFRGECSTFAARYHQEFKSAFLIQLDGNDHTIAHSVIRGWIDHRLATDAADAADLADDS